MTEKTYTMYFHNDYRCNYYYQFKQTEPELPVESDDSDEEYGECEEHDYGSFKIDSLSKDVKDYRVYLLTHDSSTYELKLVPLTSTDTIKESESILDQIHSKINGCGKFITTGYTTSYKETGSYSDPVEITNQDIIDNFNEEDAEYISPTVALVIDEDNDIIDYMSISPAA